MDSSSDNSDPPDLQSLAMSARQWAKQLGFRSLAIGPASPGKHAAHLADWLERAYHGDMQYMKSHQHLREHPEALHPGVQRVISVTMDYLSDCEAQRVLNAPQKAYIARYALGRDYHKMMRKRLARLAKRIEQVAGGGHRAFVDSAPVLERGFAQQAGLGWIGKNTMLINRQAGSWFFLGEIYTDLPLPTDSAYEAEHCGSCRACLDICPTDAFTGPYQLDARRCISYLTIESRGSIPIELRPLLGNRIFGCDDCQLACPWNRFAKLTAESDFQPRHGLDDSELLTLFGWPEQTYLANTAGSPLRRIGYECWLRNLAVALGNAPRDSAIVDALRSRLDGSSALLREHIEWALERQTGIKS